MKCTCGVGRYFDAPHFLHHQGCPLAVNTQSLIPELPDSFDKAMAKVEALRLARRDELARRDRAEWECFMHFACQNSLLQRQAE
jgi:hypothetical protein